MIQCFQPSLLSTSPLWGGRNARFCADFGWGSGGIAGATPTPNPSPQGGGE
jgi:hypothetical protein